jgi:ATP-binding cassette subfamily B protein
MEEKESKSMTLAEQKEALKFIIGFTRRYWKYFTFAILSGLVLAITNTVMPFIISNFMDKHLSKMNTTMSTVFFFAMLYVLATIVKSLSWFGQWFLYEQGTVKTNQYIRLVMYEKIHTLGMRYFDQKPTGWIISRLTNDTNLFEFWFTFLMGLTGLFSIISSYVALFVLDKQIALVMLVFLPLLLFSVYLYQKFSSRVYRDMRNKLSELNTKLNEYISGMRIIQQFRQEKRLGTEFEKTNMDYLRLRRKVVRTNALLLNSLVALLMSIAVMVALGMFGFRSFHTVIAAGVIYAFVTNIQAFFNPISQMMDFLATFSDVLVASSRIKQILREDELAPSQNENADGVISKGKIEFKNVTFSYDGENPVLKNISFVVNPGETIALVGHTGSGKSSIINVFKRFYEFGEGQILIDDKDIRDYPLDELRKKVGLVLQDAFMFVGNVKNNIRMMNKSITDEEVVAAAEFVQAHHFIEELGNGYESEVIEGGASYSSGQRQLVNFARTIVTDPKILILDEATANIDTETEMRIQKGLENMRKGRTTIAIAHRLSTIRNANLILVLEHGEIIERGTHDELLEQGGYYAEMYKLQSMKDELS